MAKSLPPESIKFASRISGNRVAMYFSDRSFANEAVSIGVVDNNQQINVLPMVRQTTRLVFSNVYPELPNQILTDHIKDFGTFETLSRKNGISFSALSEISLNDCVFI